MSARILTPVDAARILALCDRADAERAILRATFEELVGTGYAGTYYLDQINHTETTSVRARVAEALRPKGPAAEVEFRSWRETTREIMEFVRRTPAQVVLRNEYGKETRFKLDDGCEIGGKRRLVDRDAVKAIEWAAPKAANGKTVKA